MTVRRICLCLFALLAFACSDEVTRTQLTFRINAGPSVRRDIQSLRVTVRNNGDQTVSFGKDELNWPVEIVVLPEAGNKSTDTITLLVSATGAAGLLAEQRASAPFEPERVRVIDVALGGDAVLPADDGGKVERDAGSTGRDAGGDPEPDASEMETPVNCETDTKIECDDGNLCNGKETCDPKSSNADPQGCVPSSSPVTCSKDMTCDSASGECSTCLAKPDGDGDSVDSIACGGLDCNDSDKDVAPGKPEKCNNRDDDCDGTRDGPAADADCKPSAPKDGSATCVSGVCVGACTQPGYQIVNGACVKPPQGCPAANPCGMGTCAAGSPNYTCTCAVGYRAGVGMTRCVPIGIATRRIGFETTCTGLPIVAAPATELIPIAITQFAACGVNSITTGTPPVAPPLVRPLPMSTTVIAGLMTPTALEVPQGMAAATPLAQLAIGFSQPVAELGFDLLDVDNLPGLKITLRAGEKTIPEAAPVLIPGTKTVRFTHLGATQPVDQVVITYTPLATVPMAPADRLFIDDLSYRVGGCGDGEIEGTEACDDSNDVQCDGCDNACAVSSAVSAGCGM
ncbi:MAG TPA: MopE-related protein [Polyangiales bacterium]|nr:MopE-related protein [Polyangiales bacterium]